VAPSERAEGTGAKNFEHHSKHPLPLLEGEGKTEGAIEVTGERFESGRMMVFRPGDAISVRRGERAARLMVLGETPNGRRYIWWNFVASSQEKIEAAKHAWAKGGLMVLSPASGRRS
jgi:redox-sensitive bicupin YhaK (pirin superfamily)